VSNIIKYITTYQNKWVYANLFYNNLVKLLQKGVELKPLFDSEVFYLPIKYQEWPSAQPNSDDLRCFKSYDESIFDLRHAYGKVFGEDKEYSDDDMKKHVKIKYSLNILTSMLESENHTLMSALSQSGKGELFDTELVQKTIEFKWRKFASKIHFLGTTLHFLYLICLISYIKYTFVVLSPVEAD
jgi:hypothetical protein